MLTTFSRDAKTVPCLFVRYLILISTIAFYNFGFDTFETIVLKGRGYF